MADKPMKDAFYLAGGKPLCLLLHGFASTPSEVRWLGQQLNLRGYTVKGVLLAGHGTTPEQLAETSWRDWYNSAQTTLLDLVEQHRPIFVVGVSMGGLLALKLAAQHPKKVTAVVTAGTPISRRFFLDWHIHLVPLAKHFIAYQQRKISADAKEMHQQMGRVYYTRRPLSAAHQLLKLVDSVKQDITNINCPALIMHSKADKVINWRSAVELQRRLGNKAQLQLVAHSDHIITIDREKEQVLERMDKFFREIME